jgi:ribosome-binding factor A
MKRINDRMKQVLSTVLLGKIEDPRLSGVMVTDVKVDRELDYANIYVSAIEGLERSKDVMDALEHAKGFLRYEISQEVDLRVTPKLRFFWDPTPEKAARIDDLLNKWQQEEHPRLDDDTDENIDDVSDEDLDEEDQDHDFDNEEEDE